MNQGDCPLNLELGQFHLHLVGKKIWTGKCDFQYVM